VYKSILARLGNLVNLYSRSQKFKFPQQARKRKRGFRDPWLGKVAVTRSPKRCSDRQFEWGAEVPRDFLRDEGFARGFHAVLWLLSYEGGMDFVNARKEGGKIKLSEMR
jgi:hypothetical protein